MEEQALKGNWKNYLLIDNFMHGGIWDINDGNYGTSFGIK